VTHPEAGRPLVFSFQGPHGVGKSTLVLRLGTSFPQVRACTEFATHVERAKRPECVDRLDPETFGHNQRLFIDWELTRWSTFGPGEVVALDRGPEATEFYTIHYPLIRGTAWDPETVLAAELTRLRICRSTAILYLTASEECIRSRAATDDRSRPTLDRWLTVFEPLAREWFGMLPHCTFLDTSLLSEAEVLARAVELMNSQGANLAAGGR